MLCCLSWSVVSSIDNDDGHCDDDDDSGVDDDHPT
jgi:hypothetical protein